MNRNGAKPGDIGNPTGKGGFGENPHNRGGVFQKRATAALRMISALSQAAMADGGKYMDAIARDIVREAVAGDWTARNFLADRIMGRPVPVTDTPADEDRHAALDEKFTRLIEGLAARRDGEMVQ